MPFQNKTSVSNEHKNTRDTSEIEQTLTSFTRLSVQTEVYDIFHCAITIYLVLLSAGDCQSLDAL